MNRSRTPLFVGLAVLALFLCGALFFATQSGARIFFPGRGGGEMSAHIVEAALVGSDLQLTLQIDSGPTGSQLVGYYAEVNGRRFACAPSAEVASQLVCIGPAFAPGSTVVFQLFSPDGHMVLATTISLLQVSTVPGSGDTTGGGGSGGGGNSGGGGGGGGSGGSGGSGDETSGGGIGVSATAEVLNSRCLLGLVCVEVDADIDLP